jgi:hypothetical protein
LSSATATAIVSAWTSRPTKSYVLHRRLPFVCGSAPRSFNPRSANREPVVS